MRFGEWQAHMDPFGGDFGRHAVLNIGREVAPGQYEVITALTDSGVTVERVTREEGTAVGGGLHVPVFVGEVLYQALDRVYGKRNNQDGKVEALEAALAKEQYRVDFFLQNLLRPTHHISTPTPEGSPS